MDRARPLTGAVGFILLAGPALAQLSVSSQPNINTLVQAITGQGVIISNPTINCHAQGYGEFTYSGGPMGIGEGVLLTTGTINNALGPNNVVNRTFAQNTPGNTLLNTVTGRTTYDACMLEFDVVPAGDSLHFNFVLASEEYNEWVGSQYNDVFGFFISGPGIAGDPGIGADHNIALVPGTSQAVTINTVNAGSNATHFFNNTGGSGIQYDGFTVGLKAESAVQPCQTYHLKLIVADASDRLYDSGVFIEKVTSSGLHMQAHTQSGGPALVEGCNLGFVRFIRSQVTASPLNLQYYLQGTATNGVDYAAIGNPDPLVPKLITIPAGQSHVDQPITPIADGIAEPTETLRFILGNPNCPGTVIDTLTIPLLDTLVTTVSPGTTTICNGGSVQFQANGGTNFAWSPSTGLNASNIANPIASPTTTTHYQVTVTEGSCTRTMTRLVRVSNLALSASIVKPLCNGQTNGAINLSLNGGIPPYSYSWTGPGGFTASTEDISGIGSGTYTVTVTDAACTRVQSFNVLQPAPLNLTITPALLPFGHNITCFGGSDGSIATWITGGTGPYMLAWTGPGGYTSTAASINGLAAGTYSLSVIDQQGCTASAGATLVQADGVTASINGTSGESCMGASDGTATVNATGGVPPHSIQWNTLPPQTGPTATGLSSGNYTATVTDQNGCTAQAIANVPGPTASLNLTLAAQTNVACHGASTGSASVVAIGGSAPYTYSWNTIPAQNTATAVGLPIGTWTATVTDANGCTATRDVTIIQPATTLSATIGTTTNVLCHGLSSGSATVNASGGTGPYIYSWNSIPPQTGATLIAAAAGTYIVTVTDVAGCIAQATAIITQPSNPLTASIVSLTEPLCHGMATGTATINATGGVGPYTYLWNSIPPQNTATAVGLSAGNYTATVIDGAGCSTQQPVNISAPPAIVITGVIGPAACNGPSDGFVDATVTGGTGSYSYLWSGPGFYIANTEDITNVATGGYILHVTDDNGCTANLGFAVVHSGAYDISATISDHQGYGTSCEGSADGSIDLSVVGATPTYAYSWSGPGGFSAGSEDISGLLAGTYSVVITDDNGCSVAHNIEITGPPTIGITLSAPQFNGNHIGCASDSTGSIAATITGGTGALGVLWSGPGGYSSTTEDPSGLLAGIYTVQVTDANGCVGNSTLTLTQPSPISIDVPTVVHQTCFGTANGQLTAVASGGTAPYTFLWDTSPVASGATLSAVGAGTHTVTVTDANGCTAQQSASVNGPAALLALSVSAQTNILCHGDQSGSATVNAIGGTAPYGIIWNTTPPTNGATVSDLPAGTWTATVTDANGCVAALNVTISQPALAIQAFAENQSDMTCFGSNDGHITLVIIGGSGSYSVVWNTTPPQTGPTATGLAPGVYTATITDNNGCTTTKHVVVAIGGPTGPLSITANVSEFIGGSNVSCPTATDGWIDVTVTGGVTSYTYQWTDDFGGSSGLEDLSGLDADTYHLTVVDAYGCSTSDSYTLTAPLPMTVTAAVTMTACLGDPEGAIDLTVSGGSSPFTYFWTGPLGFFSSVEDINGLTAGIYTVQVTDANGCVKQEAFNAEEPGTFVINATLSSYPGGWNTSCANSSDGAIVIQTSGGTAPYTFMWSGPGGFTSTDQDLTGLYGGAYQLHLNDANGCGTLADYTLVAPPALSLALTTTLHNGYALTCPGSNDGEISATITGGTSGYVTSWNGPGGYSSALEDINGLTAGTYELNVWDLNGCTTSGSLSVNAAPALNAQVQVATYPSGHAIDCAGGSSGSLTLIITGGAGSNGIDWTGPGWFTSNSAQLTGLIAGTYTAVITDANGCSTNANATLTDPAALSSQTVASDYNGSGISCAGMNDGSIVLTFNGGASGNTIAWSGPSGFGSSSPSLTGLAAGTYTVTVTDQNGCQIGSSVVLNSPPPIAASGLISTAHCLGSPQGAVDVNASGGTGPLTYFWSGPPAFTATTEDIGGLYAGVYELTITDGNGCQSHHLFDVNEPGLFTITGTPTVHAGGYHISCAGASDGAIDVEVVGGTAPYYYSWQGPGGFASIAQDLSGLQAGVYALVLTDGNGCSSLASFNLNTPTPIQIDLTATTYTGGANVSCADVYDGGIDAVIQGGVPAYATSWAGPGGFLATGEDLTGLAPGNYTLTVTDVLGCSGQSTISLAAPAELIAMIILPNGTQVSCNDLADGVIDLDMVGGTGPYAVIWNGPSGFMSFQHHLIGLSAGDYAAAVVDANGCTAQAAVTLAEPPPVPVTLVPSLYSNGYNVPCANSSLGSIQAVFDSGSGPTLLWAGPNGFMSNASTISGLAPGSYTLTITDGTGCVTTASTSLLSPPPIVANGLLSDAGTGFNLSCTANDGAIDLSVSGGTPSYQFDWMGSAGFASMDEDLSGLNAGTYTVNVYDANGCITTLSFELLRPGTIQAPFIAQHVTCAGGSDAAIDLQPSEGVEPYSFAWTGPGGFAATTEDLAGLGQGVYTVDIIDAAGCTSQTTVSIITTSDLSVSVYVPLINGANIPCANEATGLIEVTPLLTTSPMTITWSGPDGFGASSMAITGLVAGDYTFTLTDGNGCMMDSTITLTGPSDPLGVQILAELQPTGTNVSCHGGTDGSITVTMLGGIGPFEFNWRGPDSTTYITQDISGLMAGLYEVVVVDAFGCNVFASITLTEPDSALAVMLDALSYSGFGTSCPGASDGAIDAEIQGGSGSMQIDWSGPDGFTSTGPAVSGLPEGTYSVTITDTNNCTASASITLQSPDTIGITMVPFIFPSGTAISCTGSNDGSMTANITGGVAGYTFAWSGPGGPLGDAIGISGLAPGVYCLHITDANGCEAQTCTTITEPTALLVIANATIALCGNPTGSVDLEISGGTAPYAISWSSGQTTQDLDAIPPGSYTATITDANGCTAQATALVESTPGISGGAIIDRVDCADGSDGAIDLTVLSDAAPFTFIWNTGSTEEDLVAVPVGTYTVTVTDADGCTWNSAFTVTGNSAISAQASLHTFANGYPLSAAGAHDGSISLSVTGGTPPYQYLWSTGSTSAYAVGLGEGTYAVTITDALGCQLMLTFTLEPPDELQLPTAFSPNGDGANDTYIIHGLDAYRKNRFLVVNRWGNVVYERLNYRNDWGGENREGNPLPDGTYFIILELDNGAASRQNYVDLRR